MPVYDFSNKEDAKQYEDDGQSGDNFDDPDGRFIFAIALPSRVHRAAYVKTIRAKYGDSAASELIDALREEHERRASQE